MDQQHKGGELHSSDWHAGLLQERNTRYSLEEKLDAVSAMVRYAKEHKIEKFELEGDTLDDRPKEKKVRKQAHAIRERLQDLVCSLRLRRGNHDGDIPEDHFEDYLGECEVQTGLVDVEGGLARTHWHIFDTKRVRKMTKDLERRELSSKEVCDAFDGDATLRRELAEVDDANARLEALESLSDYGRRMGERLVSAVRGLRMRISDLLRGLPVSRKKVRKHLKSWTDSLDLVSVHSAAELAALSGAWGVIGGHNHYEGLFLRDCHDPQTGELSPIVVGNCGSFVQEGHGLFAIHVLTKAKTMVLLQYSAEEGRMLPVQELSVPA